MLLGVACSGEKSGKYCGSFENEDVTLQIFENNHHYEGILYSTEVYKGSRIYYSLHCTNVVLDDGSVLFRTNSTPDLYTDSTFTKKLSANEGSFLFTKLASKIFEGKYGWDRIKFNIKDIDPGYSIRRKYYFELNRCQ